MNASSLYIAVMYRAARVVDTAPGEETLRDTRVVEWRNAVAALDAYVTAHGKKAAAHEIMAGLLAILPPKERT